MEDAKCSDNGKPSEVEAAEGKDQKAKDEQPDSEAKKAASPSKTDYKESTQGLAWRSHVILDCLQP